MQEKHCQLEEFIKQESTNWGHYFGSHWRLSLDTQGRSVESEETAVANNRPNLSHFWAKCNFLDPTIVKAMLQGTIRNDDF